MEKETFFSILEEMCSYNVENYFKDKNWYNECLASQINIDQSQQQNENHSREKIVNKLDEFHQRKLKFFEKTFKSYEEKEKSYPNLLMIPSHPAEEYAYIPNIDWNSYDFISHPDSISKFYELIVNKSLEEVFYQPENFEFNQNFLQIIKSKLDANVELNDELIKTLDSFFILNIYQGHYSTIISIYDEYYTNKKNNSFINYIDKHSNQIEKVLKETIEKLFLGDNNYEIYPIMRNWSIIDVYNISKNLLFTSTKNSDIMTQTSIATDSTYLYILLFGICGGLYKVGTGKNGSIKGKVYNQNLSLNSNEGNPMLVYVKSTNKLYLKTNQSHFGNIKIINTENLTIESIKLLNFPQNVKTMNIYEKNMNYTLLSDDYNLYALALESEGDKTDKKKYLSYKKRKEKNEEFLVNLVLYKFPLSSENIQNNRTEKDVLIDELYESFSFLFPKTKCKKALEKKNYNIEKAANYLIKSFNKEKETKVPTKKETLEEIDYSEKVILYGSKVEMAPGLNGFYEITMIPYLRCDFDPTKFDYLKWVLINNKLYAYKLKEGGCFVFSINKSDEKDFSIEIQPMKSFYYQNSKKTKNELRGVEDEFFNQFKDLIDSKKNLDMNLIINDPYKPNNNNSNNNNNNVPNNNNNSNNNASNNNNKNKNQEQGNNNNNLVEDNKISFNVFSPFIEDNPPDSNSSTFFKNFINPFFVKPFQTPEKKDPKNPSQENTEIKTEIKTETFKGTLIKKLHCLSSNTIQNIDECFCYDKNNSCYYLLGISILSISIIESSTFEDVFKNEKKLIEQCCNISLEQLVKDNKLISKLNLIYLFLNCYKYDLPWFYNNWNYFYSQLSISNYINEEKVKYSSNEYPHKLFKKKIETKNYEELENKIDISAKENETYILNRINEIIKSKIYIKFESSNPPSGKKGKSKSLSYLPQKNNSFFNWSTRSDKVYEIKDSPIMNNIYDKFSKEISANLENYRKFYGSFNQDNFDLEYQTINKLFNKEPLLYLINVYYYLKTIQFYNYNKLEGINNDIRKKLLDLLKRKKNEDITNLVYNIITNHYKFLFNNLDNQKELFSTLYTLKKSDFICDLLNLENYIKNKLINSFDKINNYKSFILMKKIDKQKKDSKVIIISSLISHYNNNTNYTPFFKIFFEENSNKNDVLKIIIREVCNKKLLFTTFFSQIFARAIFSKDMNESFFENLYQKLYDIINKLLLSPSTGSIINVSILDLCHILSYFLDYFHEKIPFMKLTNFLKSNFLIFEKLCKILKQKLPDLEKNIQLLSLKGKIFETLIDRTDVSFSNVIKFPQNNVNVVEIETSNNNLGNYISLNKDILIYSELQHSGSNISTQHLAGNNCKDFGTCFIYKVSGNNDKKKFFLLGNEITIATTNAYSLNRSDTSGELKYISTLIPELKGKEIILQTRTKNQIIDKTIMTAATKVSIFVYPFTGLLYGKGNFIIDEPSLQKIFDTLDDLDYINCIVLRKMINGITLPNTSEYHSFLSYENLSILKRFEELIPNYTFNKFYSTSNLQQNLNSFFNHNLESNPFKHILKLLDKKLFKTDEIEETKSYVINNLKGIDKLSMFNQSLWNLLKNLLYIYTNNDKDLVISFLNQIAIDIKREKVTFDLIKNYVDDCNELIKKNDKKDSSEEKNESKIYDLVQNLISEDLKTQFFSNENALNEICDVNGLNHASESLDNTLKIFTNFIYGKVDGIIHYSELKLYRELTDNEIENILINSSPYVTIPLNLINKLLFLYLFNIQYTKDKESQFKQFFFDKNVNLDMIITEIFIKYKMLALKEIGINSFYYFYNINNDSKHSNFYNRFFINSFGMFSSKFEWVIENHKNIFNIKYIEFIGTTKANIFKSILDNKKIGKNEILDIQKLIVIINDLTKLIPFIEGETRKKISDIILNCLNDIFENKKYFFKRQEFEELLILLKYLIQLLTKYDSSLSSKLITLLSNILENLFKTENDQEKTLLILKAIQNFVSSIEKDEKDIETDSIQSEKFIDIIFDILTKESSKEILNSLCSIVNIIFSKLVKQNKFISTSDFSKLYQKIGSLILLTENKKEDKSNDKYKIIFNPTSNELDYGFLINVLYYFEEKYPTSLSDYIYNEEFKNKIFSMKYEEIKIFNISKNDNINENPFLSIEMKIPQKEDKQKDDKKLQPLSIKDLLPIYSLSTLVKNSSSAVVNPATNRLKNKNKKTTNLIQKTMKLLEVQLSNLEKLEKLKSTGNSILENNKYEKLILNIFHLKRIIHHLLLAEQIGDIACIRGFSIIGPSFSIEQAKYFSKLVHLCLNYQIKSPPKNLDDDLLLYDYYDIFPPLPKLEELIEGYTNVLKETVLTFANVTIVKENLFNQILESNIEKIDLSKIVFSIDNEISGEKIGMVIEFISTLINDIIGKNEKYYEKICEDLVKALNENDDSILIGVLYIVSGEFAFLRMGKTVLFNGKKAIVINPTMTKINDCKINILNEDTDESDNSKKLKVNKEDLIIFNEVNKKIIAQLDINIIAENLINFYTNKRNKIIILLLLKILYQSENISKLNTNNKESLIKILSTQNYLIQTSSVNQSESQFIHSLFDILDKQNINFNNDIFIPRYNTNYPKKIINTKEDLNQVLPESEYLSSLPKVSFTKCLACLSNAIKFDKIVVDAIINAYKNDKYPDAVAMSTSQIRSHILNGNLKSAYTDLGVVFGGAPVTKSIFSEEYDPYQTSKEKYVIGKLFLCSDKKLQYKKPVIILLCDFINKILLVKSLDEKVEVFWTGYENLSILEWHYPANSYSYDVIVKKYEEQLSTLTSIYCNKIILKLYEDINDINIDNILNYALLLNWDENCKDNYHYLNNHNDNITIDISKNNKIKNSQFLKEWTLKKWSELEKDVKIFKMELFENIKYNNGSLLPIHKLCLGDTNDYNQYNEIIISFDTSAFLGPQATLRFYSDEDGTNLLYEVQSIKKEKYDLQSIVLNRSKIYIEYVPGTTIFYSSEWFLHSRDSSLPCSITFIPNYFKTLISLTRVFGSENDNLPSFLSHILSNLIIDNFPVVLQMKIMKTLNEIFHSIDKEKIKVLFNGCNSIDEKLSKFGIKKEILQRFIKTFSEKFEQEKEKNFASPYTIELSDCILNIFNSLHEKYENISSYLSKEHQIMLQLYQILNDIHNEKELDNNIQAEITKKINDFLRTQNQRIIIIKGIQKDMFNKINEYGGIVRSEEDIILMNNMTFILIDYFDPVKLNKIESSKEEKKEPEEEQLWECSQCHEFNDKDNTSCVFCDAPKKPVIRAKPIKIEDDSNKNSIEDENLNNDECLNKLKNKIKNSLKVEIIENNEKNIFDFIIKRFKNFKSKYIQEKKLKIEKFIEDKEKKALIYNILSSQSKITKEKILMLEDNGIDLYLDIASLTKYKINLNEISFVAKYIYSNDSNISLFSKRVNFDNISLAQFRFYLAILSKINNFLSLSLPLINPPSLNNNNTILNESSSLSTLLTKMRGITSPKIKNNLLQKIIDLSEYDEELIQIPIFKVDRISNMKNEKENSSPKKAVLKGIRRKGREIFNSFPQLNSALGTLLTKKPFKKEAEFTQVYYQYTKYDPASFRSKRIDRDHNAFKIEYINELVQGLSGPYRQFFSDITLELQNGEKVNLLIPTQNNVNNKGEYKDKFTINPKNEDFPQYEFLGVLMGICIRTGVYLPLDLCSLVWKKLINEKINLDDIKQFDEGLYQMNELLSNPNPDKELLKNTFDGITSINLSDGSEKKLQGNYDNIVESSEQRKQLLNEINNIRLNECLKQIHSIIKGLSKMIPSSLLHFFTWEEVEKLVCGKKTVDIELLKKNTVIAPELQKKDNLVKWLWEILNEFSDENKINFVKFCYAQERLPPTQEEYTKRQIQFTIKFNPHSKKDLLPRADTCFFFLILPDYSSKEIMKKMISIAISMDNIGMNGDKIDPNANSANVDNGPVFEVIRGVPRKFGFGFEINEDYEDY